MDTKLLTDSNEEFYANAAKIEHKNSDYTIINLVFPNSLWNANKTFWLSVNGYDKLN